MKLILLLILLIQIPGPPTQVRVGEHWTGPLTLGWDAVTDPNVSKYYLGWKVNGVETTIDVGLVNQFTINPIPGTTNYIRVFAVNSVGGMSLPSNELIVMSY